MFGLTNYVRSDFHSIFKGILGKKCIISIHDRMKNIYDIEMYDSKNLERDVERHKRLKFLWL